MDAADKYLRAWASTYHLTLNPIDEGSFDSLILTYDLTERDLPSATQANVNAFLRRMATGYITAMETKNVPIAPTLTNNWQAHRIKLATLAAFQLGDSDLIARAHALFDRFREDNLRPDGETLDFAQRDALHYVTFAMDSALVTALAARVHGQDWYSKVTSDGKGFPVTLAWLKPFASGEKQHVEFVKSVVPYDRQRAEAGGKEYQNLPWDPAGAIRVYWLTSLFDPSYKSLRDQLTRSAEYPQAGDRRSRERIDWLVLMDLRPQPRSKE